MVANAISRLLHLDEEQFQTLGRAKLQAMAGHLELHPRFESASAQDIGMLFKALSSAQLHRQMRPLARQALERVAVLAQNDGLRETNLESLGSLCMGLLPLIRSPELTSRHRRHALRVFNTLQPIVGRKIDLYLSGGVPQSSTDPEQYTTRCPALTFFQVLKAYTMVSRQCKPRHVEGSRQEIRQRREELGKWVDSTLERTRAAIEGDLGEMSWNLIAQIEAGDLVFDALDLRMAKESAEDYAGPSTEPVRPWRRAPEHAVGPRRARRAATRQRQHDLHRGRSAWQGSFEQCDRDEQALLAVYKADGLAVGRGPAAWGDFDVHARAYAHLQRRTLAL